MWEDIQKAWPLVATALGLFGALMGWLFGLQKSRLALDQLKAEIEKLEQRVSHLETQGHAWAESLAGIAATLGGIEKSLTRIELDVRGKVDK